MLAVPVWLNGGLPAEWTERRAKMDLVAYMLFKFHVSDLFDPKSVKYYPVHWRMNASPNIPAIQIMEWIVITFHPVHHLYFWYS